jgi:hypothetical protein
VGLPLNHRTSTNESSHLKEVTASTFKGCWDGIVKANNLLMKDPCTFRGAHVSFPCKFSLNCIGATKRGIECLRLVAQRISFFNHPFAS